MKRKLTIFILSILMNVAHATISLQLESNKVPANQPFQITLTMENVQNGSLPDLTPLNKDFSILGTERSMNYSLMNGQAHSRHQWTLTLLPKRAGSLTIPSIKVGQEKTKAQAIDVSESEITEMTNASDLDALDDVTLLTEVSVNKPYINQQVIYTVKVYNNRRFLDADYHPPQVKDALLLTLGESNNYETLLKGKTYSVKEIQYAIFPQKSGKLVITPPELNALIASQIPQRITAKALPTTLHVQPIPSPWQATTWLPAKKVKLSETYDPEQTTFKEGDTLERTVTLQATGIAHQLMPTLHFETRPEFSIYPEKPIVNTSFQQPDILGTTTYKVTYLMNKAGTIQIPALHLSWFNTKTGKPALATLPEKTITILPATTAKPTPTNPSPPQPAIAPPATPPEPQTPPVVSQKIETHSTVAWWLAGFFALAWVATLILWKYASQPKGSLSQAQKKLKTACLSHDPHATKDALLVWAHYQWPGAKFLSVSDIALRIQDSELKKQLNHLEEVLYQSEGICWKGDNLWACIAKYKPSLMQKASPGDALPPMYPKA